MTSISAEKAVAPAFPYRSTTSAYTYRWLLAIALFFIIAGGRLIVVHRYGTDLPIWDQWAAETNAFLMPLNDPDGPRVHLLQPTNEHRIFFTLLANHTLTALSGQWDARQQMVLNALIYAGIFAMFWLSLAKNLGNLSSWLLFFAVASAGGLPIVFENVIWGFQSQFFFVSGFSLCCLYFLLKSSPGSIKWHLGWLCGFCALLSFGSGLIAPAVVAVVTLSLCAVHGRPSIKFHLPTLLVSCLMLFAGWLLYPSVVYTKDLHAETSGQFFTYALAGMAWPSTDLYWLGLLIYTPSAWMVWLGIRKGSTWRQPQHVYLLAGVIWTLLQIAAIAYSRSNTTMWPPANRYGDLYLYGTIFNLAIAAHLAEKAFGVQARLGAILMGVLIATFVFGAIRASAHAFHKRLPELHAETQVFEETLSRYMVANDPSILEPGKFPYPVKDVMIFMLGHPAIKARLPSSILPIATTSLSEIPPESRLQKTSWLSRHALWLCARGVIVLTIGCVLTIVSVILVNPWQKIVW